MALVTRLEAPSNGSARSVSQEEVMGLLRGVIDPELGSDIVELGMVKDVEVGDDGFVGITVALTTAGCPLRAQIQRDVRNRIGSLPEVSEVKISWTELDAEGKAAAMARARLNARDRAGATQVPATTKILAVASGKGGVGKSSVTANLAATLADRGFVVGVLDADIWGFSIPRMLDLEGRLAGQPAEGADGDGRAPDDPGKLGGSGKAKSGKIVPHERPCGAGLLKVVSMGLLVDDEETALMWRGLMLNRAVQHFLEDVAWGDMDYLLIDMPPGTGDVQMGLARLLPHAEMLVVTTPGRNAQKVAVRAVNMARKSYLRVVGVVENMSSFTCEHGESYELFGSGGGADLARTAGVPLLGQVPIEAAVATGGDTGRPVALEDGPAAQAFREIGDRLVEEYLPPTAMAGCSARMLEAAVAALDAEMG